MRRKARTDANHASVVQALRSIGWTVMDMSRVGGGFPDLLCARGGIVMFVEIKNGAKSASRRKLTPYQETFRSKFAAVGVPVMILTCVEEALAL